MAMVTPHYISPEQARGEKDVDVRSDIYVPDAQKGTCLRLTTDGGSCDPVWKGR